MNRETIPKASAHRPTHLMTRRRRPLVERAEGIYFWSQDGRRFVDGSSGPIAVNLGYGNTNVLSAMRRQMEKTTYACRLHFENEPTEELAHDLARRMPGLDQIFFTSGGSEAVETCLKLARQWALATGQATRWKVISRMPSFHGVTYGALTVTGDGILTDGFAEQFKSMPKVPAPTAYRDLDSLTMEERGIKYADTLEEKILVEGPESILAFIMEPIGGAATSVLVAPDSYYSRIREICDRYGILLIYDEVMTGVGRTGKFLGADHWACRPDLVALGKGLGSGYAPIGAMAAPARLVQPVQEAGGFQHGYTYGSNPLSSAAGLAVLNEFDRLRLADHAATMGEVLLSGLHALADRFPFIGDVRGKGLLAAIEFMADPVTKRNFPIEMEIGERVLDLAYERGLIVYSRRVRGGMQGDCVMVCPPLIIDASEIGEIVSILGDAISVAAQAFDLPVNG
ncbi:putative aminotransferase [Ensifer psoraleae]|uniref:aminotransferase family protein n=1 Tax=Sinorhizobium psoraleae TaxID=520838 RepID=UPI00156988B8|nr:aspartate aminotransferase family protein [Sinorhizobium psoraleae]NRP76066.1 putative aminotransferase [Sinorhizobium psoraleae]